MAHRKRSKHFDVVIRFDANARTTRIRLRHRRWGNAIARFAALFHTAPQYVAPAEACVLTVWLVRDDDSVCDAGTWEMHDARGFRRCGPMPDRLPAATEPDTVIQGDVDSFSLSVQLGAFATRLENAAP